MNKNNGNVESTKQSDTEEKLINKTISNHNENNNKSPENSVQALMNIYDVDTNDLILLDNVTNNIIKLEHFKKVDVFSTLDNNCNTSTNSLNSENLSSPMQTSTDVYLDSEILSTTDMASNDSQSPKNLQTEAGKQTFEKLELQKFNNISSKPDMYHSNDSLSNPKSDQSLLNSEESCGSSPLHKVNREYKKQRKHKKRHFGVKTLQSIFHKHDGYSDISTTASEIGDEPSSQEPKKSETRTEVVPHKSPPAYTETSPQFEENIHNLLSDIFLKSFPQNSDQMSSSISLSRSVGTKKYFSFHGQNLRVGKALRLCPNEDYSDMVESEQRKEKLLARYVYKANTLNADGVGDPDFGTPV